MLKCVSANKFVSVTGVEGKILLRHPVLVRFLGPLPFCVAVFFTGCSSVEGSERAFSSDFIGAVSSLIVPFLFIFIFYFLFYFLDPKPKNRDNPLNRDKFFEAKIEEATDLLSNVL